MNNDDLKEFGAEEISQEDLNEFGAEEVSNDDLSAFGAEEVSNDTESLPALEPQEVPIDRPFDEEAISAGVDATAPITKFALAEGARNIAEIKGKDVAEDLAYKAVGGTSTPQGRKFLKENAKASGSLFNEKDIGRYALDKDLLGKAGLKSAGDAYEDISTLGKESSKKTKDLLGKVDKLTSAEDVYNRYREVLQGGDVSKLDPLSEVDRALINKLENEKQYFSGPRTAQQLEELKKGIEYNPLSATPSADKASASAKRLALKEATENAVRSSQGEDVLNEFKRLKSESGKSSVIGNMLTQKGVQDALSPSIGVMDTVTASTAGLPAAIARKGIKEYGAGIGAKLADYSSKLAGSPVAKGLTRLLPFVDVIGQTAEASEAGESLPSAAATGVAESVKNAVTGLFGSEELGPKKGSFEYQLEQGTLPKQSNAEKTLNEFKSLKNTKASSEAMSNKLSSISNGVSDKVKPILTDAASKMIDPSLSERARSAAKFAVMQQPALRSALSKDSKVKGNSEVLEQLPSGIARADSLPSQTSELDMNPFEQKEPTEEMYNDVLAQKESSDRYNIKKGDYLGRYQHSTIAMKDIGLRDDQGNWTPESGITSDEEYLANPELQDNAQALWNNKIDSYIDNKNLEQYVGKVLRHTDKSGNTKEVVLTPQGIRAMIHNSGIGNVDKLFSTGEMPYDGNGTPAIDYAEMYK
jgi:hypothetical protein